MTQAEFCRLLLEAYPEMPERFVSRTEATLRRCASSPRHTTGHIFPPKKRGLILAAALLILLFTTVAYATTHWGIFDSLSFLLGKTPPQSADSVMQSALYQETVNNVEITVQEAGYDGRTLFVRVSYRMLDVEKPLGITAQEAYGNRIPDGMAPDALMPEGVKEGAEALLEAHQVGWWMDCMWFDGRAVGMPSGSGAVISGSLTPGEIIVTEYWRLDNEDIQLDGAVDVTLPIGAWQDDEYRRTLLDPETKEMKMPDRGVVTFHLDTGSMQEKVVTEHPNRETNIGGAAAWVSDVIYTPLMTYVKLRYRLPEEEKDRLFCNGEEEAPPDSFSAALYQMELVDGGGNRLFPGHSGISAVSSAWAELTYPALEEIPQTMYLVPIENGQGDMTRAVRVR